MRSLQKVWHSIQLTLNSKKFKHSVSSRSGSRLPSSAGASSLPCSLPHVSLAPGSAGAPCRGTSCGTRNVFRLSWGLLAYAAVLECERLHSVQSLLTHIKKRWFFFLQVTIISSHMNFFLIFAQHLYLLSVLVNLPFHEGVTISCVLRAGYPVKLPMRVCSLFGSRPSLLICSVPPSLSHQMQ